MRGIERESLSGRPASVGRSPLFISSHYALGAIHALQVDSPSYVEQDSHDVAVFDDVVLALLTQDTALSGL